MTFITDDFLLQTKTAKHLYHEYAENLPIIDYHCHLNPKQIAEDHAFTDIGQMMLGGDHYKWRVMRAVGIEEAYITGSVSWEEKFCAFASALPLCIGNPLYHWTHLELKRYFGIDETLTKDSAHRIYRQCTERIAQGDFTAQALIKKSKVETLCTTDDPADSLEYHKAIKENGFGVNVLPTFRPDKVLHIHKDTFLPYVQQLGISSYEGLKQWLVDRLDHFVEAGCRLADLGLDYIPWRKGNAAEIYRQVLAGKTPTVEESEIYMTDLLLFLGEEFSKRGLCTQVHMNTIRNNNTRMYNLLGPDMGYDSIGQTMVVEPLGKLLDSLERRNALPKTILYSLDEKDNLPLATLMGCFQAPGIRGKLQLGSGWWFNDQKKGMEKQLTDLANVGVLGIFVGMLTDSRSFLSYPRHEYFRRVLCNLIGTWVEEGLYPNDSQMLNRLIRGICYENAKVYFDF